MQIGTSSFPQVSLPSLPLALSLRNNVINKVIMPCRWAGCFMSISANGANAAFQFFREEGRP